MTSLMQHALGSDWNKLPPALQAHYRPGATTETGHMDIEFPLFMLPILQVLRLLGALVRRRGTGVATTVDKRTIGHRQYWQRTMRYPAGQALRFNSVWVLAEHGQVIEFVNPFLGLRMAPYVVGDQLHYRGICFVVKLGPVQLSVPEWMALGHTTIREVALDDSHFAMDFRLTHPLLGQVFRYAGTFATEVIAPSAPPIEPIKSTDPTEDQPPRRAGCPSAKQSR